MNDGGKKLPTVKLKLDEALYKALCESSHAEDRTPVDRQIKHLLRMALGLRELDQPTFEAPTKEASSACRITIQKDPSQGHDQMEWPG